MDQGRGSCAAGAPSDERLARATRAEIDINYICPRRCKFCCNSELLKTGARMGLPKFMGIIDRMPGLSRADISGGEPYCEPQLPEMIAYLSGKKVHCDVSTGGTVWRDDVADAGKRAAKSGLFTLQISIPALTESVYDSITATTGGLPELVNNAGKFADAFGGGMKASMTICKENMGEIGLVSELAVRLGIPLFVEPMMLVGKSAATPLDVRELQLVKFFIMSLRYGGARVHFEFNEAGDSCPVFAKTYGIPATWGGCAQDGEHAYIDAYGNAAGCTFLKYPNGALSCR